MFKKSNLVISMFILLTILLAACSTTGTDTSTGNSEVPTAAAATAVPNPTATDAISNEPDNKISESKINLPEVDPSTVNGAIISAGSSTVFPLAERMADRFKQEGFAGEITIDSIGSGAGFERFCVNGETDVSNASRGIKDSEIESCAAIGRTPIEFRVGTDAIAMVVSQENDFLTGVTLEELAKIWSDDAVKWSDVNPAWPNEDIRRFAPGTDSGTFDFFIEFVMDAVYGDAGKGKMLNSVGTQYSEDDNVLVQGVQGSPYAIGFFGFAYYKENDDVLKTVSIDDVSPTEATAESGEYALSRPLFIYSDAGIMQAKPQVAAYINFFLTYVNEEIETVGYFPASGEAIDAAKQAWLDAMK